MKSIASPGEVYSERKLSELLEFATKDLQPGPGYKLDLEGVPASPLTHKELEAAFGASLDATRGANISLSYNDAAQQMVLQELSYPLQGIVGRARLHRTTTIGYTPSIELPNATFIPGRQISKQITYADGQRILAGFGIDEIPGYDPKAYKQWRADVLSKTRGWHLKERQEVPLGITADSVQSSTLVKEESLQLLGQDRLETLRKQSLTRSIVILNDMDGINSHIDFTVEVEGDMTRMYKQVYKKAGFDPLLVDFEENITDSRLEPITLNANSYYDFSNALLETIHSLKELDQDGFDSPNASAA
jgi:hypothetical protein